MTDQNDSQKFDDGDKVKLDAYISLYKQQMERFNNTQGVEWKANFGLWALLAGAAYLVADKSIAISHWAAFLILNVVWMVHLLWLVFIHDSQQIEKDLFVLYREKAAKIVGCAEDQKKVLNNPQMFRENPGVRKSVWTSLEVAITFLLCALVFVMLFYRTPPPCLNM